MKTKHTPGPWQYDTDGHFVSVSMDASKMICDIRGWGWLKNMGHQKAVETQIANAKLIAAAPELLNAALMAITYLTKVNCGDEGDQAWQYLEQAIKKATE